MKHRGQAINLKDGKRQIRQINLAIHFENSIGTVNCLSGTVSNNEWDHYYLPISRNSKRKKRVRGRTITHYQESSRAARNKEIRRTELVIFSKRCVGASLAWLRVLANQSRA